MLLVLLIKRTKNTFYNIEMLYKVRNEAIEFYDDYSSMMSLAKYRATKRKGLKILTAKQMLQRLPIALAQVKAGNSIYQNKSQKQYTTT